MAQPFGVSVAQIRPRKGDYQGNLARLAEIFAEVDQAEPRPAVLVLPETALTGYFLEGGVREHARTAGTIARDLAAAYAGAVSGKRQLDVVLGFYESWRNTLFNSAMYVTLGDGEPNIRHVHRKMFLPTYGLFDEERFVERGRDIRAFDTPHGRAAVLICEDAWHSLTATVAALDGAQVLYVVSAAPARGMWPRDDGVPGPGSVGRWDRLIREIADEHGVFVVLANLVGSEGGKVFPGASFVAGPHGEVRGRAPLWDEAVLTTTIDAADGSRARADTPLIADLEIMLPHLRASIDRIGSPATPVEFDPPAGAAPSAPKSKKKAAAATKAVDGGRSEAPPLAIDAAMTADWLVHFVREEFRRRAFDFGVVGMSGGVDSAVTAYLAARALGPDKVLGVRLPYRTSQPESLAHAQLVIDALGIKSHTLDITGAVDGYLSHEPDADPARRGNVMARVRMIALFDQGAKHRGVPIGTGNKTERLFGYFTWHADDSPPINPLGDLYKTQVLALARELGVPSVIVDKPPTADLVAGQTDEGDIGITYAKADAILNLLLSGFGAEEIVSRGFGVDEVELVHRRLGSTHWKRRLPTVAVVSPSAIGESYLRPVDY
jgi:NAD+ synthase (glutamine-hydrolysing)